MGRISKAISQWMELGGQNRASARAGTRLGAGGDDEEGLAFLPALKLRVTPVVGQNGFGQSITPSLASSSSR